MKVTKFKIYDTKNKKWIHKDPISLFGEMIIFGELMRGIRLEDYNDIEALQFTGMYDKLNKEIYEGDIVKSKSHNPENFQIEFIDGAFCCTYKDSWPIDINHFYPSIGCQIQVIGNIYDTPELMKRY
jgi:uncharacterized phage protein (TIGR01671 family)